MAQCRIEGCSNKTVAKKLCDNHYRRMKRNGSPYTHLYQTWGEAQTVRADGYIYVTRNGKQVMEHRWNMEQKIGRPLTEEEVVHHIDGDRQNNELSNLQVMTKSEHSSHHYNGKFTINGRFVGGLVNPTVKREDD